MRGKANIGRSFLHVRGITPAYAGKRMETMTRRHAVGDHPRVCGEKVDLARMPASKPGSPPRMRGKGIVLVCVGHVHGITPAYAGKSYRLLKVFVSKPGSPPRMRGKVLFCPLSCFQFKDHPRVCGEKISGTTLITTQQGSPPRMRGKAPSLRERLHWHRITPAYAGKSGISPGFLLSYRDHPRVCGEKESVNDGTAIRAGSPPRMRGKARSCQANTSVTRITPAYAGKSRRVREPDTQTAGSPPHVQGKGNYLVHRCGNTRITPACAGKRRCKAAFCAWFWDHPRVCGEKVSQRPFRAVSAGSPPRMRGKGVHGVLQELCCGITPAYAGKSLFSGLYIRINGDHPRVCGEKLLDRYWAK